MIYRGTRLFVLWLALDVAVTCAFILTLGRRYIEWRMEHPLLTVATAPLSLAVLWWFWRRHRHHVPDQIRENPGR